MAGKKNDLAWTLVAEALRLDPSISDRAVAKFLEIVSHSFVGIVRRAMVARGELPEIKARTCLDRRKRHLPRTADETDQLRQEKDRVRQEKELLRQEDERVRQEEEQKEKLADEARREHWQAKRAAKTAEIKSSLAARSSYSNRYHAYKCRVGIWRVKSIRQEMIANGELQDVAIPATRSPEEKEMFRQEKQRRLEQAEKTPSRTRLSRYEEIFGSARASKESEELPTELEKEEHEFKKRMRKAVPLNRDFGKTRHGKGRVNRKPRKRDEDD